ncbi:MAG TPA: hypothetical protein PLH98_10125 [Ruminococcus flavefaciens]|nr:hypothetical protein [Ruminococcus flavefaciens]HQM00893.1 hypothetical protein [Ruminococcus flavefaciens]
MLRLYDILRAGRTGVSADLWTSLAARAYFSARFDRTTEADYIYDGNAIVYYIGTSKRPEIPQTLGGVQVLAVERTAFNDTDVEAVKFPDGMEVIE